MSKRQNVKKEAKGYEETAWEIAWGVAEGRLSAQDVVDRCLERVAADDGWDDSDSQGVLTRSWVGDSTAPSSRTYPGPSKHPGTPEANGSGIGAGRLGDVESAPDIGASARLGTGAFLHCDAEAARARAGAIDEARKAGESLGPLAGVLVAVKDNICTRDAPTTCASKMLRGFRARYDAEVIERLEAAGAVILGKTNLDEFAMGSSTENSAACLTRNPLRADRVAGGSSGGSAAAVAAGMVPAALGSDTGGSVRLPAAFCGVVGLKPTYGRVSRYGLVAFGSSLDQIGPIARDVRDAALLLGVIAGHDPRDSTSVDEPVPDYVAGLDEPLSGVRVGVSTAFFTDGVDAPVRDAVKAAVATMERNGARIVEIDLPHMKYAIACYYIIAPAEASSNLARYDGVRYGFRAGRPRDIQELYLSTRGEGFGAEVKRRIMLGTYVLSSGYYEAYYVKALKVRTLIKEDFERAFERVDVIASPVSPTTAFQIGERIDDPLRMYMGDLYTLSANLAGIPAISVPCGLDAEGLPIGLQLLAPAFGEQKLLSVAHQYETLASRA